MKKIISLLMILLTVSFTAFASSALSLSEGNADGLTLYGPNGTRLDSLTDVGESGMVIQTMEAVTFTSSYGDIQLSGDSMLAVTGFDLRNPSLYLIYGEMNVYLRADIEMKIFTPSSFVTLPGAGVYGFVSTDDEEIFRNLSENEISAYDGIRGITETVSPMEELNYLMWPRVKESALPDSPSASSPQINVTMPEPVIIDVEAPEPSIPSAPSISEPDLDVTMPEPVIVEVSEPEIMTPSVPSLSEPQLDVTMPEPMIVDVSKPEPLLPSAPSIGEPVIDVAAPEPVVTEIEPYAAAIPESAQISEPEISVEKAEPVIIDIGKEQTMNVPSVPAITDAEISVSGTIPVIIDAGSAENAVPEETTGTNEAAEPGETHEYVISDGSKEEASSSEMTIKPITMTKEKEQSSSLFSGEIELGYDYILETGASIFEVTPKILIGNEDYSIGLRAPLRMHVLNENFYLAGFYGYDKWDFGESETDPGMKVYRAVTDSFAIIDSLNLGHEESSLAYINADRNYIKNGTIFLNYGGDDALAVRMGFNFPNLSLSVYADNAQAPHVVEGGLRFYPGTFGGPSFGISIPGEILMKNSFKDYVLIFYPEVNLTIPFSDSKFDISIYALGELSTVYENGTMKSSRIIYDFANSKMGSYMAGLSLGMNLETVSLTIDGGIRSGSLTPSRFNEISAYSHSITIPVSDIANPVTDKIHVYAKANLSLDFGFLGFNAVYAVSDIMGYTANAGDYFSLALNGKISDIVKFYGSFAKNNFASSFTDLNSYFTKDAIFALGADFLFGNVGISAEFKTIFNEKLGTYINILDYSGMADTCLSVKARLQF